MTKLESKKNLVITRKGKSNFIQVLFFCLERLERKMIKHITFTNSNYLESTPCRFAGFIECESLLKTLLEQARIVRNGGGGHQLFGHDSVTVVCMRGADDFARPRPVGKVLKIRLNKDV